MKKLIALTLAFVMLHTVPVAAAPHPLKDKLIKSALYVNCGEKSSGLGFAISFYKVITPAHVTQAMTECTWETLDHFKKGTMRRVDLDLKRDTAIFMATGDNNTSLPMPLEVAKDLPDATEELAWLAHLGNSDPYFVCVGRFMDVPVPGPRGAIDGYSRPGSSGSPILNSKGEVVGFITGGFQETDDQGRISNRALVIFMPIVGRKY